MDVTNGVVSDDTIYYDGAAHPPGRELPAAGTTLDRALSNLVNGVHVLRKRSGRSKQPVDKGPADESPERSRIRVLDRRLDGRHRVPPPHGPRPIEGVGTTTVASWSLLGMTLNHALM